MRNLDKLEIAYLHVSMIISAFMQELKRPIGMVLRKNIDIIEKKFNVPIRTSKSLDELISSVDRLFGDITRLVEGRDLIEDSILEVDKAIAEIGRENVLKILKEDGIEFTGPRKTLFIYRRAERRGMKVTLRYTDKKYEGFYLPVVIIFKRVFLLIMLRHPLCLLYRHVSMLLDSLMKETRRPFGNILEDHIESLTKKYAGRILSLHSIEEVSQEVEKIRPHIQTKLIDGKDLIDEHLIEPYRVIAEIPGREEMLHDLKEHNIEFIAPVRLLFIYYRAKSKGYEVVLRHADKKYGEFYLPVLIIYK